MLRRQRADAPVGAVPAEITDLGHPVWATKQSTSAFLRRHGLTIGREIEYGPVNRCIAAGCAWAWANGVTRTVEWGSGVSLDLPRMREMDIRAGTSGSAANHERLDWANQRASGRQR